MSGRAVSIAVDGARLHGEWCAEPVAGRPALVFLHDGLGSVENWRGLPARIGRRLGTGAFAYDRWGYGRSDGRAPFPIDFIEQEAARLPRILRIAGIGDGEGFDLDQGGADHRHISAEHMAGVAGKFHVVGAGPCDQQAGGHVTSVTVVCASSRCYLPWDKTATGRPMSDTTTILGIESSCDDTAAAIVRVGGAVPEILSSVVDGQTELHDAYGGVVPEIAARAATGIGAIEGMTPPLPPGAGADAASSEIHR